MKKYVKSEDVLQILVNIEDEMDYNLEQDEKLGLETALYAGKYEAYHDVVMALEELLGIQGLDIKVELEDEDD